MPAVDPICRVFSVETQDDLAHVGEMACSSGVRYILPDGRTVEGFVDGHEVAWVRRDETGFAAPLIGTLKPPFKVQYYAAQKLDESEGVEVQAGVLKSESQVTIYQSQCRTTPVPVLDGERNHWLLHRLDTEDTGQDGTESATQPVVAARVDFDEGGGPVAVIQPLEEPPLPITVVEMI